MLERIKNVLRNRKAEGDKGFSLVELAVVIAVIAILVAIAVPVFMNIQQGANDAAGQAAAANGSSMAVAALAANPSTDLTTDLDFSALVEAPVTLVESTGGNTLSDYCVTATYDGGSQPTATKGPGC